MLKNFDTETRYSNIERECLAVMFDLEKFEYYLMGCHTAIETDHSPLEHIFKKNIAEVSTQLQHMILWCFRFDITVKYKPGIKIPAAEAYQEYVYSVQRTSLSRKKSASSTTCRLQSSYSA